MYVTPMIVTLAGVRTTDNPVSFGKLIECYGYLHWRLSSYQDF